jgi:hypothetical protein
MMLSIVVHGPVFCRMVVSPLHIRTSVVADGWLKLHVEALPPRDYFIYFDC